MRGIASISANLFRPKHHMYNKDTIVRFIKGDAKKSSKNVLLNNADLVNSRVKPQAKGQNNFSLALK